MFVVIPTHLRLMMQVADLLHNSGKFRPVIVYCPSSVFENNHENCQQSEHDAFIWTGSQFLSKEDYLRVFRHSDASAHGMPYKWLSPRFLNKKNIRDLAGRFPFFPGLYHLLMGVRFIVLASISLIKFFVGFFGVLRSVFWGLVSFATAPAAQQEMKSNFVNRNWLQRFLLHSFAAEWNAPIRQKAVSGLRFRQRLLRLFRDGLFVGLGDQKIFYKLISELIEFEKPQLIILPEANLFYNSQYIIRAAHLKSISVAIVPFTIVNTLEWAEAFFEIPRYQANKNWNRIFARAFPHWVLEHKGRRLLLPPSYILGCEYLDMVPAVPWLVNSSDADAIASESNFMTEYYIRAGIQKEKIYFTGSISDDKLFSLLLERNQHRKILEKRHGILLKDKVILIGLPPDQFGAGRRKGCEFENYEDLIRFMVATIVNLSGINATVLINLHPRIKRASVACLSGLGATIIDEPIERLVPLSDVYVAVASATIRLGISCGIPVVNFDAYQYDYDDYKKLAGVCEVKSKNNYKIVIDKLIHDHCFYSKILMAQKNTADNLCPVDGKAGERLLSLFNDLTSR